MGRIADISQQAITNEFYRHVLGTATHLQVVIMSIPPGGEVGEETHADNDQLLYLVEGRGTVILDDVEAPYETGDAVLVPAGTKHNFLAATDAALKIMTVYGPAHHPDGLIQGTKAEAGAESATG